MAEDSIPRRSFLKGAGAAGAAAATVMTGQGATAQAETLASNAAAPAASETYLTLTATEAAFLSAAYDTFIPADKLSPSGTDCGLVIYMDGQLAGAWGGGARLYRSGPFVEGKPEQGYQLSLTPREFFAAGIKAANAWSRKTYGKEFDRRPSSPTRRWASRAPPMRGSSAIRSRAAATSAPATAAPRTIPAVPSWEPTPPPAR
jgi:gluconate 2-dehydrogenase gamma chain